MIPPKAKRDKRETAFARIMHAGAGDTLLPPTLHNRPHVHGQRAQGLILDSAVKTGTVSSSVLSLMEAKDRQENRASFKRGD